MERRRQSEHAPSPRSFTRRDAIRGIGVGAAAALGIGAPGYRVAAQPASGPAGVEPKAGGWHTWVLERGDQLRPGPPPNDDEDFEWSGRTSPQTTAPGMMMHWNAGSPGYRWNQVATRYALDAGLGAGRAYRLMALLNVAIHDATVAVWDAKYAYHRPRPVVTNPSAMGAYLPAPNSPSYPSVHAATAGAAETVLAHLFPDDRSALKVLADEAAMVLASGGAEYVSDVESGRAIGAQVGEMVVAWAEADNADAAFDPASLPTGEGLWTGEPEEPTLGEWVTWVLPSGSAIPVDPPPAMDPSGSAAMVAEVRGHLRDADASSTLAFWPDDPLGRPAPDTEPVSRRQAAYHYSRAAHLLWVPELAQKLAEYRLDTNPPWAARAYAMVSIAVYDATVSAWNQKFRYMMPRPNQLDPSISPLLPTPATPAYPSGHAAAFGAVAEVLGSLFGWDAGYHHTRAIEGAAARAWAGVTFGSAGAAGLALGRDVGARVVSHVLIDRARDSAWPTAVAPYLDPSCR